MNPSTLRALWPWFVIAAAIACLAAEPPQEPDEDGARPAKLYVRGALVGEPMPTGIAWHHKGGFFDSGTRPNGDVLWIASQMPGNVSEQTGSLVKYAGLRPGDIVPLLTPFHNTIYRLSHYDGPKMVFERVPEKELPKGVSVNRLAYVLPLRATGRIQERTTILKRIAAGQDGIPVATIRIEDFIPTNKPGINIADDKDVFVRAGDFLTVHDFRYRVLAIIPPDEKQRVVGWVELQAFAWAPLVPASADDEEFHFDPPGEFQLDLKEQATPQLRIPYTARKGEGQFAFELSSQAAFERWPKPELGSFSVRYPRVARGTAVPLLSPYLNALYQEGPSRWSRVHEDTLPEELRVSRLAYVIPLGGVGRLEGDALAVRAIGRDPSHARGALATLKRLSARENEFTAGAGDRLTFGGKRFAVLRVVPPDDKHNTIGWIELHPVAADEKNDNATAPDKLEIMHHIDFYLGRRAKSVDPQHAAHLDIVVTRDGVNEAVGTCVFVRVDQLSAATRLRFRHMYAPDFMLRYPNLRAGQLLPMLGPLCGAVYRVESAGHPSAVARVGLRRLAEDELPPGVRVGKETYAIPMGGKGELYHYKLWVKEIAAATADAAPRAEIEAFKPVNLLPDAPQKREKFSVCVGDQITLDGFRHKIVNIVPPDAERRVLGWVEIEPVGQAIEPDEEPKKPE
jgi:hypothetical protein